MIELSNHFVNISLAAGEKALILGFIEYNLQIPGTSSYNLDRVALLIKDDTNFTLEVPLMIGMKTGDTILKALKEGEIEKRDQVWRRVKVNHSLTKLHEEVSIQKAMIPVAKAMG